MKLNCYKMNISCNCIFILRGILDISFLNIGIYDIFILGSKIFTNKNVNKIGQ